MFDVILSDTEEVKKEAEIEQEARPCNKPSVTNKKGRYFIDWVSIEQIEGECELTEDGFKEKFKKVCPVPRYEKIISLFTDGVENSKNITIAMRQLFNHIAKVIDGDNIYHIILSDGIIFKKYECVVQLGEVQVHVVK